MEQLAAIQARQNVSIDDQILEINRRLVVLRRRLTITADTLDEEDESVKEIAKSIQALKQSKRELEQKKLSKDQIGGPQEIKEFYTVLSNFEAKWTTLSLEKKQKLMDLLIDKIEIDALTPHWMQLHVHWKTSIHPDPRPDHALLWRVQGSQIDKKFTEQELAILRADYPTCTRWTDLLRKLPTRSWTCIKSFASIEKITKLRGYTATADFPDFACWADLSIVPDPARALDLIRTAVHTCRQKQQPISSLWLLPAAAEEIYALFLSALSASEDTGEVVSVMP